MSELEELSRANEPSFEESVANSLEKQADNVLLDNPLHSIIDVVSEMHKGDELLAGVLYLSGITATMDTDQLHVYIVGQSGKGKSHLAEQVLKIFPKNRRHTLSGLSSKSVLYAANEINLAGTIIYCDEAESAQEAIPILRTITSSRTQGTGSEYWTVDDERKSKRLAFDAPIAMWLSSEQPLTDKQLKNRFIIINPDESKEQDIEVHNQQKEKYGIGNNRVTSTEEFSAVQSATAEIMNAKKDVTIPFAKEIIFGDISNRRNFLFFLLLVKAATRVYHKQRRVIDDRLVATRFDFDLAKLLWEDFNELQAAKVSRYAMEVYAAIPIDENSPVTNKDIARTLGCSTDKAYQRARELLKAGLINKAKTDKKWCYWRSQQKLAKLEIRVDWPSFTKERLAEVSKVISDKPIDELDSLYQEIVKEDQTRLSVYQKYKREIKKTQSEENKEGELRFGDNQSPQSVVQSTIDKNSEAIA